MAPATKSNSLKGRSTKRSKLVKKKENLFPLRNVVLKRSLKNRKVAAMKNHKLAVINNKEVKAIKKGKLAVNKKLKTVAISRKENAGLGKKVNSNKGKIYLKVQKDVADANGKKKTTAKTNLESVKNGVAAKLDKKVIASKRELATKMTTASSIMKMKLAIKKAKLVNRRQPEAAPDDNKVVASKRKLATKMTTASSIKKKKLAIKKAKLVNRRQPEAAPDDKVVASKRKLATKMTTASSIKKKKLAIKKAKLVNRRQPEAAPDDKKVDASKSQPVTKMTTASSIKKKKLVIKKAKLANKKQPEVTTNAIKVDASKSQLVTKMTTASSIKKKTLAVKKAKLVNRRQPEAKTDAKKVVASKSQLVTKMTTASSIKKKKLAIKKAKLANITKKEILAVVSGERNIVDIRKNVNESAQVDGNSGVTARVSRVKDQRTNKSHKLGNAESRKSVKAKDSATGVHSEATKKKAGKIANQKKKVVNKKVKNESESQADNKKKQLMKKRVIKGVRSKKLTVKSKKFSLDHRGSKMKHGRMHQRDLDPRNALGYKVLQEKERELALELFGDDADAPPCATEDLGHASVEDVEMAEQGVEEPRVKEDAPGIPHDPCDIHQPKVTTTRKPAWVDEDDELIRVKDVVASMTKARGSRGVRETSDQRYQDTLQQRFMQVLGSTPDWADLDRRQDQSDEEDDIVRSTGNYISKDCSVRLAKDILSYKAVTDLNKDSRNEGAVIKCVEFNPHFQVGLVAGFSGTTIGTASLFQVDGIQNSKIQSVRFPKFPIKCAKFMPDGKRFLVSSTGAGHFFEYDLEAGKESKIPANLTEDRWSKKTFTVSPDGEILVFLGKSGLHLFDTSSFSLIDTLQVPSEVSCLAFNSTGSRLYTHGNGGNVYVWDMSSRVCVQKFYDDGCIDGTSITVSPNNQYLACGSSSGIVNVYDLAALTSSHNPAPIKILSKLLTPVTSLAFNSTAEILATASNQIENAMKLVHFPSMTYFNNFPDTNWNLKRVQTLSFSPKSGYLSAGSNNGTAYLYRVNHYSNY